MNQDKDIWEGLLRNQADAQRRLLQQYGERVFAQIARIILIRIRKKRSKLSLPTRKNM